MLTVRYPLLGLRPGERLLDFGCGGGRHTFAAMRAGATVTAVDIDPAQVRQTAGWVMALLDEDKDTAGAGGQGHAVVAAGENLPFDGPTFERIVAAEVLEHVADDDVVLSELAEVLRPGGTLAVTVPRWGPERLYWALSEQYHNTPGGHVRIYRRRQLRKKLVACGLQPYRAHHAHALHSPYWLLKCAFGLSKPDNTFLRAYHRMLVWEIATGSRWARWPDRALNPLVGKSLVIYARKP